MKAVVQRVKHSSVIINNEVYSQIGQGILVLLGIEKDDTEQEAKYLADKIVNLRIFENDDGKMNYSVQDIKGELLVVSQFTLAGECSKGNRPAFDKAEKPERAVTIYEKFIEFAKNRKIPVKTGKFGAMMDISLVNDGPVTFILSKKSL